jgi:hypothetical protein
VPDDSEVIQLLKANLEAQNRTTHAVRSFVRFYLIQVVSVLVAAPLYAWGIAAAEVFPLILAGAILVIGLIWALAVCWLELEQSDEAEDPEDQVEHAFVAPSDGTLRERFESIAPLMGKRYVEIYSVAGQPSSRVDVGYGAEVMRWQSPDYVVELRFDKNKVCVKVLQGPDSA